MAEATKMPVKTAEKSDQASSAIEAWRPFDSLRQEIDRLFDDFGRGLWNAPLRASRFASEPFWRRELTWHAEPAVDVTESEKAYEITAELPGMDEKSIEVKLVDGGLTIKGEKQEEKEERKKDYYLHERRFGAFERTFRMPEGIDADKIEAKFKNGVLNVVLPKTPEAQKAAKKITVKAA